MTYTIRVENTLTGHARFTGEYTTLEDAIQRAQALASRTRSFTRYIVWTGHCKAVGEPTEHVFTGAL